MYLYKGLRPRPPNLDPPHSKTQLRPCSCSGAHCKRTRLLQQFRGRSSTPSTLLCGVPQGSVLGPILFLLYTADLIRLVEIRGLHPHLFADDMQMMIYGSCRPEETQTLMMDRMSACISDVTEWMQSNRLQLNMTKSELLWCASSRQQHLTPNAPLRGCADDIAPTKYVRDLGIYRQ